MHDMESKQKQSKYKRPYKDKPYTSPIKRAEVVGLHLAHKTRTEIATLTGLNRQTVSRILSQSEVEALLQTYRSHVLQMIPDALDGLHVLIREIDRTAIIEALYGAKVFTERKELEGSRPKERTYAFTKVAFFHKFGRMPTPAETIKFDKTLDVEPLVKASEE
jgi:hypothetical protein